MVEARPAATVLLLRDGADGIEVLMLRRAQELRYLGGAWFPSGAVDAADADDLARAACRETAEECGVELEPAALLPWCRWITGAGVPRRFDTTFFAARMPEGAEPHVVAAESTELMWLDPRVPVEPVAPPTQLTLADLADAGVRHGSVDAVIVGEAGRAVPPILPKLVECAGAPVAILPWDNDYAVSPGEGLPLAEVPPHLARLPSRVVPSPILSIRR